MKANDIPARLLRARMATIDLAPEAAAIAELRQLTTEINAAAAQAETLIRACPALGISDLWARSIRQNAGSLYHEIDTAANDAFGGGR